MTDARPSFGWPIFRSPLLWGMLVWFVGMFVFGLSMAVVIMTPGKWDGAVVLGTCGGLPLLQRQDGSVWLRVSSVRLYRVEDPTKLTCG